MTPSKALGAGASSPVASKAGASWLLKLALTGGVLVATIVLDRALGCFGLPSEAPTFPVAPPFFEARVESLEYSYTRRTNERGIRYRRIPEKKPQGTYRVVLIGDSFTEGACVEDEERWSDLIERQIAAEGGPPVELVNCGEAGTHPPDYARTLMQLGLDYQPDAVVLGIYFDDVPNTPRDLDPSSVLAEHGPEVHGLAGLVHALWPHASTWIVRRYQHPPEREREQRILDLIALARETAQQRGIDEATFERWRSAVPGELVDAVAQGRLSPGLLTHGLTRPNFFYDGIGLESEDARARWESLARLLDAVSARLRERGIRLGIVLMPSVHQFDPGSSERVMALLYAALDHPVRQEWTAEATPLEVELASWCGRAEVPFLDLVPIFRKAVQDAREPLNYAIDPHWTPAGHVVAAQAIRGWMESSGLLPEPE